MFCVIRWNEACRICLAAKRLRRLFPRRPNVLKVAPIVRIFVWHSQLQNGARAGGRAGGRVRWELILCCCHCDLRDASLPVHRAVGPLRLYQLVDSNFVADLHVLLRARLDVQGQQRNTNVPRPSEARICQRVLEVCENRGTPQPVGCHRLPYYGVSCSVHQVIGQEQRAFRSAHGIQLANTVGRKTRLRDKTSIAARSEPCVQRGTSSGFRCGLILLGHHVADSGSRVDTLPRHGDASACLRHTCGAAGSSACAMTRLVCVPTLWWAARPAVGLEPENALTVAAALMDALTSSAASWPWKPTPAATVTS